MLKESRRLQSQLGERRSITSIITIIIVKQIGEATTSGSDYGGNIFSRPHRRLIGQLTSTKLYEKESNRISAEIIG